MTPPIPPRPDLLELANAAEVALKALLAERDGLRAEIRELAQALDIVGEQRDRAEAENRELREALQMLWDHYLLVITDEQKAQVAKALGA